MKKDEPFDPSIKSGTIPQGLIFRLATRQDVHAISVLMAERNPNQSFADIETSRISQAFFLRRELKFSEVSA